MSRVGRQNGTEFSKVYELGELMLMGFST